jgi:hypothetical protein
MKALFRLFGILTLLNAALLALLVYANRYARQNGGHDLSGLTMFIYPSVLIGIGLLFLRKWAAILLSLPLLATSVWLIVGSILAVPFPYMIINFLFALMLLIPAAATVNYWTELKWKGKWFI